MIKNKLFGIFVLMIFIILQLSGCFEEQTDVEKIKYKSTEIVNLAEKQGKMTFEITIRTNETARLWLPYPVSNEHQIVENVRISGNYNYSSILREQENGIMILLKSRFNYF